VAGCTPDVEKDLAKSGKRIADVPFVRSHLGWGMNSFTAL
jgi:hypothetical protein